jgi:hypothetical protein
MTDLSALVVAAYVFADESEFECRSQFRPSRLLERPNVWVSAAIALPGASPADHALSTHLRAPYTTVSCTTI